MGSSRWGVLAGTLALLGCAGTQADLEVTYYHLTF